jgi:CRP/FNR family transcriptional regulator, cyclic AMP receptor protein
MGLGLVEEIIKWQRRGTDEPWLPDSFMTELSPESISRLERHATPLYSFEHVDWMAADSPVAIVLLGTAIVCRDRWDGHSTIERITGIGDVVNGETLFTDPVPMRLVRPSVGTALAVPRRKFRDLMDNDEEIRQAMLRTLSYWLRESTVHRSHSGRRVEQRLWAFLVRLGRRHGSPSSEGVEVSVGLTQPDLAAAIGASNNAVEAALKQLRDAGKLTTRYASCVLHELPTEEELDQGF